jgi:alkanesulfonate monooxygenase SsuD/methylene tetrahydromethanopterin reductase-like flavin-dependent oxidoreductase (luciferase family)
VTPVQKPWPPIYFAALSAGSYEVAGEKGYPILGIPYASCKDMADVKQKIAGYKDGSRRTATIRNESTSWNVFTRTSR